MPVAGGFTVPVPTGNVALTVTGVFPLPYQVLVEPSWDTVTAVSGKTATQWVVTFTVAAPAGATLDYFIVAPTAPIAIGVGTLAGSIITKVRDLIPDPVYDNLNNPLPDTDGGLFRAQTLYRWLDDAVRVMARLCGSVVDDWTAMAATSRQPWYALDPHFDTIDAAFSNQWPISLRELAEQDVIWPSTAMATSQSLWGGLRKRTDHLELFLWPVPSLTDPLTTLSAPIAASGVSTITVGSTANFLSFGYVQIDAEIIQYQQVVSPGVIGVLSRGQAGTTPAMHLVNAAVQHLGIWAKGKRSPAQVTASQSPIELPMDVDPLLEDYLLSMCRQAENEYEEARRLRKDFDQWCKDIKADPTRKEQYGIIPAYGSPKVGPIYGGGMGRIVP